MPDEPVPPFVSVLSGRYTAVVSERGAAGSSPVGLCPRASDAVFRTTTFALAVVHAMAAAASAFATFGAGERAVASSVVWALLALGLYVGVATGIRALSTSRRGALLGRLAASASVLGFIAVAPYVTLFVLLS
jgi:hypothetical protein